MNTNTHRHTATATRTAIVKLSVSRLLNKNIGGLDIGKLVVKIMQINIYIIYIGGCIRCDGAMCGRLLPVVHQKVLVGKVIGKMVRANGDGEPTFKPNEHDLKPGRATIFRPTFVVNGVRYYFFFLLLKRRYHACK